MDKVRKYFNLAMPFLLLGLSFLRMQNADLAETIEASVNDIRRALNLDEVDTVSGQARGYAEIKIFCDNTISAMEQLLESELPNDEKLAQMKEQEERLSNPSLVYQAERGKDASYLAGAKMQAKTLLNSVE